MKLFGISTATLVLGTCAAFVPGCGDFKAEPGDDTAEDETENEDSSGGRFAFNAVISECRGFDFETRKAEDYCAAERLVWQYDKAQGVLDMRDARVMLNCCGDHSATMKKVGEADYEIVELDRPQDGELRCRCSCVFDFDVAAEGVQGGVIHLLVKRKIEEEPEEKVVFDGEIDLGQGQGAVVLDDVPLDEFICSMAGA